MKKLSSFCQIWETDESQEHMYYSKLSFKLQNKKTRLIKTELKVIYFDSLCEEYWGKIFFQFAM